MADIEATKVYIKTRHQYVELIKKELLGPGSEISIPDEQHELITNSPDVRYSIGMLFPKNNVINADNDDSARVEESVEEENKEDVPDEQPTGAESGIEKPEAVNPSDEENLDEEIGLAAQNMPSSMGITFFAKGDSSVINCQVTFATYKHAKASDCCIPFCPAKPDDFVVPEQLASYITFDKAEKCLKYAGIYSLLVASLRAWRQMRSY